MEVFTLALFLILWLATLPSHRSRMRRMRRTREQRALAQFTRQYQRRKR